MDRYTGPYADRFVQALHVETGAGDYGVDRAATSVLGNDDWQVRPIPTPERRTGSALILAVSTPAGLVGFFAATEVDAIRIRASIA